MYMSKAKWKRNLVKIVNIIWEQSSNTEVLPDTLIVNYVKELNLKTLNCVDVLSYDEGPVYLTEVLEEYLEGKYGCPVKSFELDYVYDD